VHRFNTHSLLRTIREALAELGPHPAPLLVTGSPPSVGVVGQLGECASVYLCMDDFLHLPTTTPRMLAPLEARLLERVDAVVATAEILTRSKRPRSGRVHHLPQGVNYQHFATPRAVPAELASLPRPIVGFAGAFYDRCDFELLRRIADANASGSVVLVGPILDDPRHIDRPNVHLLGPRAYRDLPAYVQAFDVGIIPYVLNDETRAVDPLKLLEYLAAGIPVVCTALPEARKYAEVVAIAEDRTAFVDAVMEAARESDEGAPERRRAVARPHGWDRRAEALLGICAQLVRD
jgi:glycosyltransferase involved in cell wall biosynthesis